MKPINQFNRTRNKTVVFCALAVFGVNAFDASQAAPRKKVPQKRVKPQSQAPEWNGLAMQVVLPPQKLIDEVTETWNPSAPFEGGTLLYQLTESGQYGEESEYILVRAVAPDGLLLAYRVRSSYGYVSYDDFEISPDKHTILLGGHNIWNWQTDGDKVMIGGSVERERPRVSWSPDSRHFRYMTTITYAEGNAWGGGNTYLVPNFFDVRRRIEVPYKAADWKSKTILWLEKSNKNKRSISGTSAPAGAESPDKQ